MNSIESSSSRRGKIARLPANLRRDLNVRLENNEPADSLLAWLNSLPETKRVLDDQFGGAPISPQNLSEWRLGGFREWLLLQELMDHAARFHDGAEALQSQCEAQTLADNLATVLAARYAALLNVWDGEITPEFEAKIRFLRGLTHDITQLQKSLHRAAQQQRDLTRQKKADAAEDLAQTKKDAITRLKTPNRQTQWARVYGAELGDAIALVEGAQSENEVHTLLHDIPSGSIILNQTISELPTPHPAPEPLNTEN